jgi:hypothetical protein
MNEKSRLSAADRDWILRTVREEIERDHAALSESFAIVGKFAAGAVTFLTIALGVLGWKTCADVEHNATEAVASHLKLDDAESPLRRELRDIVDKALLESYVIQMRPSRTSVTHQGKVERAHVSRLVRLVTDERSELSTFSAAVYVLTADEELLSEEGGNTPVGAILTSLMSAKDDYKWIATQSGKRRYLLERLIAAKVGSVVPIVRQILASGLNENADPVLVVTAIDGALQLNHAELREFIRALGADERYANDAFIALVLFDPTDAFVTQRLQRLETEAANTSADLLRRLLERESTLKRAAPLQVAAPLFSRAMRDESWTYFWQPSLLNGPTGTNLLTKVVTDAAKTSNYALIRKVVRSIDTGVLSGETTRPRIEIWPSANTVLVFSNAPSLMRKDLAGPCTMRASRDGELLISCWRHSGNAVTGSLIRIESPEGLWVRVRLTELDAPRVSG